MCNVSKLNFQGLRFYRGSNFSFSNWFLQSQLLLTVINLLFLLLLLLSLLLQTNIIIGPWVTNKLQEHLSSLQCSTYLPCDNKLVRPSTNGAYVRRIFIWDLLRRHTDFRERTAFTKPDRVASLDTKRIVSPWIQTDGGIVTACRHSRSFGEQVRLVKRRVVVDDVMTDRIVVIAAWCPHNLSTLWSTTSQVDVIRRVWPTCTQAAQVNFLFLITKQRRQILHHSTHRWRKLRYT